MQIGTRVEYETGWAESGFGIVIGYNKETDILTVQDEEDRSTWAGPAERATPLGEQVPQ